MSEEAGAAAQGTEPKGKPSGVEKLLETARDRFKRCRESEAENRERALQALKFRNLDQWPEQIKREREKDPEGARPCLVADKLNQYVHQVVNDGRQNRPSIKARPVDDQADKEVAKIFDGIIRHIEDVSRAQIAYDTGLEHAVDGGFGYWRVITEYCDEMSFEQDIRIKRIRNRFTVFLDPDHQEPDGSDATFGFILDRMPREEFKRLYPKADPLEWESDGQVFAGWIFQDDIVVAEYFRIELEDATICLWGDGSVSVKGSDEDKQYAAQGLAKIEERDTKIPKVKWSKITAKDELDKRDWQGKYVPIVKVEGNELDIEGRLKLSGLVLPAMDSQRIHNYALSAFVEQIALAPRAPWVAAEGQLEGYEGEWKSANRRNLAVLTYKPVTIDDTLAPPPQRQPPPGIPVGWQAVLADTEHGIEASMGMYKASLGAPSNEKSGVAIQQRERQSDTATFHYIDNLSRSIEFTGRILIDLIPKIYDTERVARILGDDGNVGTAQLDPEQGEAMVEQPGEDGSIERIYNLNVGKYDVTVSVGPSYSTKRQESAAVMAQIAQAWPDFMARAGDIAIRSQDWPDADKLADRLKLFLPPQVRQMEGDGKESPEVAQAKQLVTSAQQELQKQAQALQHAHGELAVEQQKLREQQMQLDYEKKLLLMREQFSQRVDAARKSAEWAEQKAMLDRVITDVQGMFHDAELRMREMAVAGATDAMKALHADLDDKVQGIANHLAMFEVQAQPEEAAAE
jgi:hypothetical protein